MRMRQLTLILCATLFVCSQAFGEVRSEVHIYQYYFDKDHSQKFSKFKSIISEKIIGIQDSPENSNIQDVLGLLDFKTVRGPDGKPVLFESINYAELREYWKEKFALQVVYGRIESSSNKFFAVSNFHFGDLRHELERSVFRAKIEISNAEFDNTRDLHTASMLYALALSALGLVGDTTEPDCGKATVGGSILRLAFENANDAEANGATKPLTSAVAASIEALVEKCP